MASFVLGDRVLDIGLAALDTEADKIFVCSAEPTTYAEASATFALGVKTFTQGTVFGAAGAGSPNGRQVTSAPVVGGSITANGTVSYYAVVDSTTSRLLARGVVSGGGAVTNGQSFTLAAVTIKIPSTAVAGGAYAGPGDVVAAARAFWGLRAYTLASIGGNAVRLRRDSDDTLQIFVTIAGGGLDLAAIASFKGAANLFVNTLYDQTGNGFDLTSLSNSNQPGFLLSGVGSLPCMTFNGSSQALSAAGGNNITQNQPATASIFAFNTSVGSQAIAFCIPTYNAIGFTGSGQATIYAGANLSATAADSTWHAMQGVFNGGPTSSDMNLNGAPNVGDAGTNTVASTPTIGGLDAGTQLFTGRVAEAGYWPVAFSGANSTAISSQQHTYYGV